MGPNPLAREGLEDQCVTLRDLGDSLDDRFACQKVVDTRPRMDVRGLLRGDTRPMQVQTEMSNMGVSFVHEF